MSRPERRHLLVRRGLAGLLLLLIVGTGLFARILFLDNFDVVEPGKVYRSAQPRGDLSWFRRYRFGSILNLRGGSPADPWYAGEVRACEREGIDFYDLPLVATRRPTRAELLVVLDLFPRCRYPLLIHCKSGSDRTGLVSALYWLSVLGEPPDRALAAFSVWRGHVPVAGTELVEEPVREYGAWLKNQRLAHSPARFRRWVESEYRSDEGEETSVPVLRPGPRPQVPTPARIAAGAGR